MVATLDPYIRRDTVVERKQIEIGFRGAWTDQQRKRP